MRVDDGRRYTVRDLLRAYKDRELPPILIRYAGYRMDGGELQYHPIQMSHMTMDQLLADEAFLCLEGHLRMFSPALGTESASFYIASPWMHVRKALHVFPSVHLYANTVGWWICLHSAYHAPGAITYPYTPAADPDPAVFKAYVCEQFVAMDKMSPDELRDYHCNQQNPLWAWVNHEPLRNFWLATNAPLRKKV